MSHPHPHPENVDADLGAAVTDPLVDTAPPGALRRRVLIAVALASLVVIAAVVLTWQALVRQDAARDATAAASRACRQVEGLGQTCVTEAPTGDEIATAAAIVPVGPSSVAPLPGAPSAHHTATAAAGTPVAPDETAAQAHRPDENVNPGDDRIVGLTVRDGRLEITYADGTVVDAGAIVGAPPPIVLIVPSPAADGRGPNGIEASTPAAPRAPPVDQNAPTGATTASTAEETTP